MRLIKKLMAFIVVCALIGGILYIPLNTKQGINFKVTTKKIPLYAKYCGFFYRDYQYRALSRDITKGISGDKEKVMAAYSWTINNIKRQPEDFPIVDDHIWDIIIRRYGVADQMADVFTTLASYSGHEAFFASPRISRYLVLSFVKIGEQWHMFDVYNNEALIITRGGLEDETPQGLTYGEALNEIDTELFETRIRRADKQKFIPRLIYETRKFIAKVKVLSQQVKDTVNQWKDRSQKNTT